MLKKWLGLERDRHLESLVDCASDGPQADKLRGRIRQIDDILSLTGEELSNAR